jgi:hypothetical protein
MEVHFPPDVQAKLDRLASDTGTNCCKMPLPVISTS